MASSFLKKRNGVSFRVCPIYTETVRVPLSVYLHLSLGAEDDEADVRREAA